MEGELGVWLVVRLMGRHLGRRDALRVQNALTQGGHSPHTLIRPSVLRAVAPMRRWAQKKARGFHGYRRQKPAGWVLWMEGQPWRAARDFSRLETRKLIQEKGKPGTCH